MGPEIPDASDVERALDGDAEAFTRLIRRHDERLRRFVHGLLFDRSLLDDAMQETYLKAYRSLRSFQGESSFSTWIHRVAYNATIDLNRKNSRLVAVGDEMFVATPATSSLEGSGERLDILAAMRHLSETQRACVLLVDGQGYDYAAAGSILGIPSGTIGFHLHRARKTLRSELRTTSEEQS